MLLNAGQLQVTIIFNLFKQRREISMPMRFNSLKDAYIIQSSGILDPEKFTKQTMESHKM